MFTVESGNFPHRPTTRGQRVSAGFGTRGDGVREDVYIGWCEHAKAHFKIKEEIQCCSSCHYDDEDGNSSLLEEFVTGFSWEYFQVCCTVATAIEKAKENERD